MLAEPSGRWNAIIGPGYDATKVEIGETIQLILDGKAQAVRPEMMRARCTGVFYGTGVIGAIRYKIIDHGRSGDRWLSRLVIVENMDSKAHEIAVRAQMRNAEDSLKDEQGRSFGYQNGALKVTFSDPSTSACPDVNTIDSSVVTLQPGTSHTVGLIHFADDGTDPNALAKVRAMDSIDLARQSIAAWQRWFDSVPAAYKLDRIADPRARDLVEGGLSVLRANRSADGGFMATPTMYQNSYMRDCAMCLKGLTQTGHFDEAVF